MRVVREKDNARSAAEEQNLMPLALRSNPTRWKNAASKDVSFIVDALT